MPIVLVSPYRKLLASLIGNGDPYMDKVALLMNMDGADGSTTFNDKSGKTVTRTGASIAISTAQSKFGGASLYTPDQTQYLTVAASSSFSFTGDFTVECWVMFPSIPTSYVDFLGNVRSGAGNWIFEAGGNGSIGAYMNGGSETNHVYTTANAIVAGQWYHCAMVRTGTTAAFYFNGDQIGTRTISGEMGANSEVYIGSRPNSGGNGTVYVDEVRITNGYARYTNSFLPPSAAFPDFGTDPDYDFVKLLLQMDGAHGSTTFTDAKAHPITVSGVTVDNTVKKFNQSARFYGNISSYLSTPNHADFDFGAADFTIEYWINPISFTDLAYGVVGKWPTSWLVYMNPSGIFFYINGGTIAVSASTPTWQFGSWYHIAITRSGTTWTIWVNGSAIATAENASAITTGTETLFVGKNGANDRNFVNANIDDLRITKGKARYTAPFLPPNAPFPTIKTSTAVSTDLFFNNVTMSLHLNGANNSTAFTDVKGHAFSQAGGAVISTAQSKFGGSSAYFDGDALLATAFVPEFAFGTGDFTVEAWVRPTARNTSSQIIGQHNYGIANNWLFSILESGVVTFYTQSGASVASTGTVPLNAWTHVVAVRQSGVLTIYINGVKDGFATVTTDMGSTINLTIGGSANSNANAYFTGYIDEVRVTRGTARYTAAFTPPDAEFPDVQVADEYASYVNVYMPLTGANGSTNVVDQKGHNVTLFGDAKISTTQSPYGQGSLYCDGTGDYISIAAEALGADDFTVEFLTLIPEAFAFGGFIQMSSTPTGITSDLTTNAFSLEMSSSVPRLDAGGNAASSAIGMSINYWHHIAIVKRNGVTKFYLNGILRATCNDTRNYTGGNIVLGAYFNTSTTVKAYFSNLRVTKGVARYLSNFDPASYSVPMQY